MMMKADLGSIGIECIALQVWTSRPARADTEQLSVHMFDTAHTSNDMHSVLPSSVEIISHYQITGLDKCIQRETHAGPTGAVAHK